MKQLFFLFILSILILATPLLSFAQGTPTKIGIDESTVIFASCRLSNLVDKSTATPIKETKEEAEADKIKQDVRKNDYVKGCIQEIIRFVIVIASLAAILKIAASGLALLDPSGSKVSQKLTSRSTITNLVIGLFLLIVGWNMIPILNASFNSVNFLDLPRVNYCDIKDGCVSERKLKIQRYRSCTQRYEEIMDEKLYKTSKDNQDVLVKCIIEYCQVKEQYDEIENDSCDDIKNTRNPKDVNKRIDELNKEGDELRKQQAAGGDNTPSSDLEAEVIRLVKAGKINQIDGQPEVIIKQVQDKLLKKVTLKFLASLAKSPGIDSIKIWEPFRKEDPPRFHGKGLAVDLRSVTMGGKEYTAEDAFAGTADEQYKKVANFIFDFKTTRQIIMAGNIVDKLRADPKFSAASRQGTISKIRIATTPDKPNKTERHEDHWHVDMFE
jgi:hypothetical protein